MDLTGGSDTRLLAVIFKSVGLDFETAVSGTPGHYDVEISQKVAAELGTKHYVTYHDVENIDLAGELEETFINGDGFSDVLAAHRLYQLGRDRAQRNIELAIGGSGGELYKDGGWWRVAMQTLFHPGWDKAIVKKLVYSGLAGWGYQTQMPVSLFADKFREICLTYMEDLYAYLLQNYQEHTRVKMSDKIFYEYSVNSPRGMPGDVVKR
jgi:asparagine synthetase B (glutamine-hydrolysing)